MVYENTKRHQKQRGKAVGEDCITIIIREILDAAGLKEFEINKHIIKTFHTKLAVLLTKGKEAGKKGGSSMKRFLLSLKSKSYMFRVYHEEMEKVIFREEKEKLRVETELLEAQLSASEKKCQNLEKYAAKVERSALFWKKRFQNIVSQVIKQKRRRGEKKKEKPFKIIQPKAIDV